MKKYWEEPICGIYRISHRDSDKSYIGQSRDIFRRWKDHSNFSKKKLSCISSALKLHGLQSFVWEVIEECSLEELNDREVYWISYFNSMSPNGYNLTSGGNQTTTISEETRVKLSESHKGKKQSEEQKAKTGASHRGMKRSNETKARISDSKKLYINEEFSHKMSAALKGKKKSEEHKAKISAIQTGRKFSRKKVQCPYCLKTGGSNLMKRYHFDNCKLKPQSLLESETASTSAEQLHSSVQQTSDK